MFSYHNHSDFSDGRASAEEMLVSAYNHGIREYGFSDHFGIWPDGSYEQVSVTDLNRYFEKLQTLRECYAHKINVKFGAELENIPETNGENCKILNRYPIDYIIGGTHYIGKWAFDSSKEEWTVLGKEGIEKKIEEYWDAEYTMCREADIDIVAHFDLYEKWGPLTEKDYTDRLVECVKVCKERGLATEINTAKRDPLNHFYPSEKFLKIIAEYDIPVILSADAHYPIHVTQNFEEGKKLFAKYGIKHTARFSERKITVEDVKF